MVVSLRRIYVVPRQAQDLRPTVFGSYRPTLPNKPFWSNLYPIVLARCSVKSASAMMVAKPVVNLTNSTKNGIILRSFSCRDSLFTVGGGISLV